MAISKGVKNKATTIKVDFLSHLENFLGNIRGLEKALSTSMTLSVALYKRESERSADFVTKNGVNIRNKKNIRTFNLEIRDQSEYEKLLSQERSSEVAIKLIPRSIFVSLVSQFDLLVGNMMNAVLIRYPERISKDRTLTFKEVSAFSSIQEIEQYFINEEIDMVLRGDHAGHVDWFEKKIGIKLKESLGKQWGTFIELTERRNLFVHADGIVNNHYLRNCRKGKVELGQDVKGGNMLDVPPEYFKEAYRCLFEISSKLSWLVWRNMESKNIEVIDEFFNDDIIIDLINHGEYSLAERILVFIIANSDKSSDLTKNLSLINLVLIKKLSGKTDDAMKLLETKDWSACSLEFKLAVCVLREDFTEALVLMKKIGGKSETLSRGNYESDPLFKGLREQKEFKKLFKKLFGENYIAREENLPKKEALKISPKRKV